MRINPLISKHVIFLMLVGLSLLYWMYWQALPGYWMYDDWPNLAGLAEVKDTVTAGHFIFSGHAGALGRPVSLSTFVLQADAWNGNPAAMLQVNFFIHLLATAGCFFFTLGLTSIRLEQARYSQAQWIALTTALLWGFAPFLATTHLMIIQRMTSLSGMFLLWGLAFFVWAHIYQAKNQKKHIIIFMLLGPGLMTLLSTLSKESGALLPLLASLILWFWIPKEYRLSSKASRWLLWILVFIPTLLLLGYLLQGFMETMLRGNYGARRYFTPAERLMTQPLILLDYLRWLLFPQASAASPFMDQLPVSKGWFEPRSTFFAILFWVVLLGAALLVRKRLPAFSLGIVFFLCGHILESTYIGLELYFAHRNYIPSVGLYFALAYICIIHAGAMKNAVNFLLCAYLVFFVLILWQTTSGWRDGVISGAMWAKHNPHSIRAAQFLSNQYTTAGRYVEAREALEAAAQQHPESVLLQIQTLNNCVKAENNFEKKKQQVLEKLRSTKILTPLAAYEVSDIAEHEPHAPLCSLRTPEVILDISDTLLKNPVYQKNSFARSKLHLAKAFVFSHQNKDKEAAHEFLESFRARPDLDVAFYGTALLANLGDYAQAYQFLHEVQSKAPAQPLAKEIWSQRLQDYQKIIEASEAIDKQKSQHE